MKTLIAAMTAASFALLPGLASAQTANANAGSNSLSQSGSSSSVNIQNSRGHRAVGAAFPPGLVAGGLTCQGSASFGAGGPGWGVALGSTRMDRDCNLRESAKTIYLMGERAAAREVLCNIREVRNALASVGRPCSADRAVAVSNRRSLSTTTATYGYPAKKMKGQKTAYRDPWKVIPNSWK
ncbi:hypothetical protein GOC14_07210 [Sinorhizobium meliloti]|nr:hypothetical protein [Sinorhizobium meliloti]